MRELYSGDQAITPDQVHLARRSDGAVDLRIGALSLVTALPSEGIDQVEAAREVYARIGQVAAQALEACDQRLYRMRLQYEAASHSALAAAPLPAPVIVPARVSGLIPPPPPLPPEQHDDQQDDRTAGPPADPPVASVGPGDTAQFAAITSAEVPG